MHRWYCLSTLALLHSSAVGVASFVQPVTHHSRSTTTLHEKSLNEAELKVELAGYLKTRDDANADDVAKA